MGRAIYTLFYIWQSVWPQPFTSLLHFKSSLVKEDRNPPSTSFPELQWEGYSGVATAVIVAVILETSYLSSTLYPSLHYPQDILIWRVWIIIVTILLKGRLRPHMVIWLTQHYRTESLLKLMSFQWNMLKILIIRGLMKMIRKYTVPLQWQL